MIYLKIKGLVIFRERLKENDGYIYILTDKGEVMKFLISGIFQIRSKNLSLIQIGNFLQVFGLREGENNKIISVLPLRVTPFKFRKYPYLYLWSFFLLKNLKINILGEKIFFLSNNLYDFIKQNPRVFPLWFLYHLLKELGFSPELERCFNCNEKLVNEVYFDNKACLYCRKCRKASFLKVEIRDYLKSLRIMDEKKLPQQIPDFLKKILLYYLKKVKKLV